MPNEVPENLAGLPIALFETPEAWEAWISAHFADSEGLWLKVVKKGAAARSVSHAEALDIALCWGWIDGQLKSYDASYYLRQFTPRRARSVWSKANVANVARLEAAGRMRPAGLAAVEAAKKDGRWERAYDSCANATVPEDFREALGRNPKAAAYFASLSRSDSYAFLWRLQTAPTPEKRRLTLEKLVALLNDEKKPR